MPYRKTPLRETSGVQLVQVDEISANGTRIRATHYRLSTLRPNPPRLIADEQDALNAFDLEVIASLADPVVARALDR